MDPGAAPLRGLSGTTAQFRANGDAPQTFVQAAYQLLNSASWVRA